MPEPIVQAARLLTRHAGIRSRLLPAIADNLAGQPRAASYDDDRSSAAPWCWDHQRPVPQCHRADLLCSGETLTSSDPTGEAAVNPDKARADQAELKELERKVVDLCNRIANIDDRYLPELLPTGADKAKLATEGDPGCWFCEQARSWSPPHTKNPTDVGGNLKVPRLVCSGHYDLIRKHLGRAPSKQENEAYVRRGKYPKKVA